jgi:hypothetical protein
MRWIIARGATYGCFLAICACSAIAMQLFTERLDERGFSLDHRVASLLAILCVAAVITAIALARRFAALSPRELQYELRLQLARLPFGGRGSRFSLLTFATTVGFAALAHAGEPRPLLHHDDIAFWILVAVLTAIAAAIVSWLAMRVAPQIIALIVAFFIANHDSEANFLATRFAHTARPPREYWLPLFIRPPPLGR